MDVIDLQGSLVELERKVDKYFIYIYILVIIYHPDLRLIKTKEKLKLPVKVSRGEMSSVWFDLEASNPETGCDLCLPFYRQLVWPYSSCKAMAASDYLQP